MRALTESAGATTTPRQLWKQWMGAFADCDDPHGYGIGCPRVEAGLASSDPFLEGADNSFEPVAIMNRFDLAPKNGAHCGEYRIIYALHNVRPVGSPPDPRLIDRGFLIFEAALPNPEPARGADACLPVAKFWRDLSDVADATERASRIAAFFYTGTAIQGFPAVVDAAHYGGPGQIRTNMFVESEQWNLREFKLDRACGSTCTLSFRRAPVQQNPAEELFQNDASGFWNAFVSQVGPLSAPSVSGIRMSLAARFDEQESASSASTAVVYRNKANLQLIKPILASLDARGSTLTPNNIFDRATSQTCAGCHQLSNGAPLGDGLTWPSSLGFVHVDEQSHLSPALTGTFLPHRKTVLAKFIADRCSGVSESDTAETLGGSAVGAAN
jgi:hypothetical protein